MVIHFKKIFIKKFMVQALHERNCSVEGAKQQTTFKKLTPCISANNLWKKF